MVKYDHITICGDFNVHVCCESQPLTRDFLNLLDSFSLKQTVFGPTHEKGHTLDLVLSYGVSVSVNEICAMSFSDHSPILFSVSVPCSSSTPSVSKRVSRLINPSTAGQFSAAFNDSPLCRPSLGLSSDFTADQLLQYLCSLQPALEFWTPLLLSSPNVLNSVITMAQRCNARPQACL